MTKSEDTVEALKSLVIFLIKRVREVSASTETLRALLVQHGVLPQDAYDTTYPLALKEWDRALNAALLEAEAIASDAELHQLLQSLKLPPQ